MKKSKFFLLLVAFLLLPKLSFAGSVDAHAPIGIMSDHKHRAGEWMTSYRYMRMDMPDNYTGTTKQSVADVNNDFMIAPIDMTMEMHMVGLMYGVSDELTMMLMVPYVVKDMEHQRRTDGRRFSTKTEGIGDIKLSSMLSLEGLTKQPMHLNLGVSFPSGSINQTDDTLLGQDQDLPYPMQLGSGTYDFHPGITYFDKKENWSWGAQALSVVRFGRNEHKYRLGNNYEVTSWIARKWNEFMSTSFRVKSSIWGNISGADSRLIPVMVPTANPQLRGGERIDLFLGVNLLSHEGKFKDHRLAFEFGYPVYQNLDGPQLGVGLNGTVGWQRAF